MNLIKKKSYAYVTSGNKLLVMSHPDHPEAGLQVPGGTVKEGEDWVAAALREVEEESGLRDLEPAGIIGFQDYDMAQWRNEIQMRAFVHLIYLGQAGKSWDHHEMLADGNGPPVRLKFNWVEIDGTDQGLIAGQGELLKKIRF